VYDTLIDGARLAFDFTFLLALLYLVIGLIHP
jgi:hypothetical protein